MLAGFLQDLGLDIQNQIACVSGEQFDLVLCGLVGSQKAVQLVAAAAVYRRVHDLVEAADSLSAAGEEDPLGALSGVDVAVENVIRVLEDGLGLVGEDDLALRAALTDEVSVVLHIIHAGELVLVDTEELSVFCQGQNIAVRVDARFIDLVEADQLVADFVGGIAEHQNDLLGAHCDAAQADRESVSGQDREDHADGFAAKLGPDVRRYVIYGAVISLRSRNDGLGNCDHVAVAELKSFALCCLQHTVCDDRSKIIAFSDDGASDSP